MPDSSVQEPDLQQAVLPPVSVVSGVMHRTHKTVAWPLALVYVALIFYASLYPFHWHARGIVPVAFLWAPFPRYWSAFDVVINLLGYAPLGALLALTVLQGGVLPQGSQRHALWLAVLFSAVLSLCMEVLQVFIPLRVASKEDLALNILGAALGAVAGLFLQRWGLVAHWGRLRQRWLAEPCRAALVLLVLWPVALLFPAAVPLGLGQVLMRIDRLLAWCFADTPFVVWLPLAGDVSQALAPAAQVLCVLLGMLVPCLLGFCVIRMAVQRLFFVLAMVFCALGVTAFSAALSWGPGHAWAWLDRPTQLGLALGVLLALALSRVAWRVCAALLLWALGIYLALLNQAPESPYFAQTLQEWEQGQFIRFNGLAQWVGWVWPYAVLVYVVVLLWRRDVPP